MADPEVGAIYKVIKTVVPVDGTNRHAVTAGNLVVFRELAVRSSAALEVGCGKEGWWVVRLKDQPPGDGDRFIEARNCEPIKSTTRAGKWPDQIQVVAFFNTHMLCCGPWIHHVSTSILVSNLNSIFLAIINVSAVRKEDCCATLRPLLLKKYGEKLGGLKWECFEEKNDCEYRESHTKCTSVWA